MLQVKELTRSFSAWGHIAFPAVDHVSFSLAPGETLGILGESGCGKTTLAKLIMGFLEPTSGQILLNGQDITGTKAPGRREAYRQMQMVFQNPTGSFDPRRTLGDGIGESLRNAGVPKEARQAQVEALLFQCGLGAEFAWRYPHEVSGGQCQRAAIARALAIEPRLLICDEATSSLDVTVRQQIMELLEQLRRERNLSCLFITHDENLAHSFCHRILTMGQGRIISEKSL